MKRRRKYIPLQSPEGMMANPCGDGYISIETIEVLCKTILAKWDMDKFSGSHKNQNLHFSQDETYNLRRKK